MTSRKNRVISLILAVMLTLSALLATGVFSITAASGDTIYFDKPADWNDSVYIYWWSGSGAPSWPGVKMTQVSGNIYSYTAKSSFTEFNINDGGAENVANPHQTVNLNWPGDGKIGTIGKSAGDNEFGNECWNLSWSAFTGLGLSVSADTADCDFLGSLTVTLKVSSATSATYTINGGDAVAFKDGDKITIGEDGKAGDVFTLELSATDGTETETAKYTYIKTDTPVADAIVYFDNSQFNWENVYCYAYGTKENAKWPGKAMSFDENTGYYYMTFDSSYKSENIIFNDGQDGDINPEAQQYPKASGLAMSTGDCKLLTKELQWIDYGKPDSKPYGFAYTATGSKFSTETINVDIDLKNAVSGTYSIDGGSEMPYTERTTITVGEGKIGNSDITLTLKAKAENGIETTTVLTFNKTFSATQTTFESDSDGHTTDALAGYYATNPNMQLGSYKTGITVDGDPSDWNSSMLIAQGVANDDPRVYMPSSIHERSVDDYALYAAWDDDNIYFMWEMANVSAILGGNDIFSAQKPNGSIWNPGLPVYLVLSVDPEKHASGKARELDVKSNTWIESDSVWGSGLTFDTNIDTFIAFDSANTNGGAAIIPLDDEGFFNYSESINIGRPTNDPGVLNRNGFKIGWDYGTLSDTIIGINGFGGSRTIGDTYDTNSEWIDFFDKGYKKDAGFIYEISIPLEHLGIDKAYIEENGIGAMLISTYGTSAMNTLPHDPSVLDNADMEYSFDPSTSHEKEDADNISVPLARVGALLSDTVVTDAPLEVNFGADKAAAQGVNTQLTLTAEAYNGTAPYTYEFTVDGKSVASTGNSASWTPTEKGVYTIAVKVTDAEGDTVSSEKTFTVGEEVEVVIPPTKPTEPDTTPTTNPTTPPDDKYILGDANLDNSVNIKDATAIQKHIAQLELIAQGTALTCADADLDGEINIKDATAIQKYAASLPVDTPVGEYI
ncbi:MAG: starch-binding protein [Ruminococcus sp.]|nr:starch-binding protein [Ruminococcus sp.]